MPNPTSGDNDVVVATLSVGSPAYDLTIRLRGQNLLVGELPPPDGGSAATTLHIGEMADLSSTTSFVKVHLGVDVDGKTLRFDVGESLLFDGSLLAPISTAGGLPLTLVIGATTTPPFSAAVPYRIDDVTLDSP